MKGYCLREKDGNLRARSVCRGQRCVNIGNMGIMRKNKFLIKRAHKGISIWTFSYSDIS